MTKGTNFIDTNANNIKTVTANSIQPQSNPHPALFCFTLVNAADITHINVTEKLIYLFKRFVIVYCTGTPFDKGLTEIWTFIKYPLFILSLKITI